MVGEVRQQECLDLLIALNSGIPGMCTIHANSAREAITKMCTLPLLAGENIGSRFVVPTVAGCVDIVVHLVTEPDGSRQVREIVAVPGRVEGDVVELEPIFAVRGERLVRIDGYPPHAERFERVGIDIAGVLGESPGAATREGAADGCAAGTDVRPGTAPHLAVGSGPEEESRYPTRTAGPAPDRRHDRRQRDYPSMQVVQAHDSLGNVIAESRSPETAAEFVQRRG